MIIWAKNELKRIGESDELEIASLRSDGTLRSPVTIWVVRVEDNLYVRAVKGRTGPWFRGTQTRQAGRVQSGGITKDVIFVDEADLRVNEQIDVAYRQKYSKYPKAYVDACLTEAARAATIRLVPRSESA